MIEGQKQPPILLDKLKVQYPEHLRRAGIEGKVNLLIKIDDNGVPINIEVLDGSTEEFVEHSIQIIRELRFVAAKENGKAVEALMKQTIEYKIQHSWKEIFGRHFSIGRIFKVYAVGFGGGFLIVLIALVLILGKDFFDFLLSLISIRK